MWDLHQNLNSLLIEEIYTSLKSVVVKHIASSDFHFRGQVNFIEMSEMNLQAILSSYGVTPYKYLLLSGFYLLGGGGWGGSFLPKHLIKCTINRNILFNG